MARSKTACQKAIKMLKPWLNTRGLRLSREKTCIRHIEEGIDFLGVNIRHYKKQGKKREKVMLIKPSKAAMQNFC